MYHADSRDDGRRSKNPSRMSYAEPPHGPAAPAAPDMTSKIEQLKQLGELKNQGVLTEAEFEEQKRNILAS